MKKTTLLIVATLLCAAVAHADVAVIVSTKSRMSTMTADEISRIYLGRSSALKPLDNAGKSPPVRDRFYARITGKDEAQLKAIWSRLVFTGKGAPPKILSSDAEVLKAVAADANAIGYVDKSAVDAAVKIVYEVK